MSDAATLNILIPDLLPGQVARLYRGNRRFALLPGDEVLLRPGDVLELPAVVPRREDDAPGPQHP